MSSWAEQYEAKKAVRMKEEQMKLNKNLGFGFSVNSSDLGKDLKKVNGLKVENDSGEENLKKQPRNLDVIGEIKPESSVIPNSSIDDFKPASTDPWYSAYKAKKAEAVENLKSGNLKSVSGSSGFVGKIEGVEHLSKNNEVTKLMNRFKQEDPKPNTNTELMKVELSNCKRNGEKADSKQSTQPTLCQPSFADSGSTTTPASSLSPPPPPRQLLQLSMPASLPDDPSSPPSDRPSRPSVPTPGKYGTLYGGAPSPGPNPSRSFQPPGFVPPTPPANMARRRPWPDSQAGTITHSHSKDEKEKDSMQSLVRSAKADSKLSTSSWQEEYLARKKARLGDS